MKVKLKKCAFFQEEVKYFGYVISKDDVATDPDKISAVTNWASSANVFELRYFLGFASYYQRFVKGFAKLAAPLHHLVAEIQCNQGRHRQLALRDYWTEECEQSFQDLKAKSMRASVLACANFSLPFILEIDSSYSGLGAVLSQEQGGKIRPVAYASCG